MSGVGFGEKEGGGVAPIRIDEDGRQVVVAETTGPGGAGLAEEATLQEAKDAAESIATTVTPGGVPTPGQPALAVVNVDPAPTFAAAPPTGTDTGAVYWAGAGPQVTDRDGNLRYAFVDPNSSVIEGNTGLAASQLEEINLKTPDLEGGRVPVETELGASGALATETKQDVGNASLASIDGKTPALGQAPAGASSPAVLPMTQSSGEIAQQISVDQIEPKLDTLNTDKATATLQATGNGFLATIAAICTITLTQLRDALATVLEAIRDRLAQRTTDPLTNAPAQVVRAVSDPCSFVQTTPGSPTYYLQVSTTPARLSSFKMINTSPGADVYVMVFDLNTYTPGATPDILKRRINVPLRASQGGTPGGCIYSLTDAEMNAVLDGTSTPMFASGILVVIASGAASSAPATGAAIQMEVFKKAALS